MVKAYWWRGNALNSVRNWGDELAPLLLKRFANLDAEWDTVSRSRVVTVGSVMEHIPPLWEGFVLGTGVLYPDSRLHLHTGSMTILGVRGPLTADLCPPGDYVLGDPGLLADELVESGGKRWDLGVVPHWTDTGLAANEQWYGDWTTRVIHPDEDPLDVVRAIASCHKIVTSSLHGMIVADANSIPRRVVSSMGTMTEGAMFKFRDYSASLDMPFEPDKTVLADRYVVEGIKHRLFDVYEELGRRVRNGRDRG